MFVQFSPLTTSVSYFVSFHFHQKPTYTHKQEIKKGFNPTNYTNTMRKTDYKAAVDDGVEGVG